MCIALGDSCFHPYLFCKFRLERFHSLVFGQGILSAPQLVIGHSEVVSGVRVEVLNARGLLESIDSFFQRAFLREAKAHSIPGAIIIGIGRDNLRKFRNRLVEVVKVVKLETKIEACVAVCGDQAQRFPK
jgi:hypothetical protein